MELQTDITLRAWNLKRDGKYILIIIALWLAVWLIFSLPPRRPDCGQGGKKKTADSKTDSILCMNLKAWYLGYNEQYFLNMLPANAIVEYGEIGNDLGITFKDHGVFRIVISPRFNQAPNTAHLTILHEACHIATWEKEFDSHGPKFRACMDKLYQQGAFEGLL